MPARFAVAAAACSSLALAAPASAALPEDQRGPRELAQAVRSFTVPLAGPLHERFGYDRGRLHSGLDIAVLGTDTVRAALPGVVAAVGYLSSYAGYGLIVKLRHAGGIATMYAHLASASVRVGARVERGQAIARAGCTGSCTGPHLHFEVRLYGTLVDPLPFLRGRVR